MWGCVEVCTSEGEGVQAVRQRSLEMDRRALRYIPRWSEELTGARAGYELMRRVDRNRFGTVIHHSEERETEMLM